MEFFSDSNERNPVTWYARLDLHKLQMYVLGTLRSRWDNLGKSDAGCQIKPFQVILTHMEPLLAGVAVGKRVSI